MITVIKMYNEYSISVNFKIESTSHRGVIIY